MALAELSNHDVALWRFGPMVFDETLQRLLRDGTPVDVEPAPLRLLQALLAQANTAITREVLLRHVWQRDPKLLSRNVLPNAVGKLRRALGDDDQTLIVTVPGVGYRLDAVVERVEPELPAAFRLAAGEALPHWPEWRFVNCIHADAVNEVWLLQHRETHAARVAKIATDSQQIQGLVQQATVSRLLSEAFDDSPAFVKLHAWHLEPPHAALLYDYAGLDLARWATIRGGLSALSRNEKLQIIAAVAESVALAHSIGVLHMDLKPANILIEEGPQWPPRVRVADFGSGRLLQPELLEQFEITRPQDAEPSTTAATPLYLAPERLRGQPATMTADVYSLGVLLYQMLCNDFHRPISIGWETAIDSSVLRDDLTRALHGEPTRRLGSAGEFARLLSSLNEREEQDQQRRRREAQAAATQQALARMQASRRWLQALAAVIVVALAAGIFSGWRFIQQRDAARQQLQRANAIRGVLIDGMLEQANPFEAGSASISLLEALRHSASRIGDDKTLQATTQAQVHAWLARDFRRLGDAQTAEAHMRQALELYNRAEGEGSTDVIRSRCMLADILRDENRLKDAQDMLASVPSVASIRDPEARMRCAESTGLQAVERRDWPAAADAMDLAAAAATLVDKDLTASGYARIQRNQALLWVLTGRTEAGLDALQSLATTGVAAPSPSKWSNQLQWIAALIHAGRRQAAQQALANLPTHSAVGTGMPISLAQEAHQLRTLLASSAAFQTRLLIRGHDELALSLGPPAPQVQSGTPMQHPPRHDLN